jgi:hypothetical protein
MKFTANDFTTEFPNEWEDRTMVTLFAPFTPGSFASNVVITKHNVESNISVEDFAKEQIQLLQTSLPGFELLDQRLTTVNGYPAYQLLHRFQSEHGILQQVQAFLLHETKIFAVTGTSRIEEFDKNIQAFRQIVENFRAE